jgi:hypothetical protein
MNKELRLRSATVLFVYLRLVDADLNSKIAENRVFGYCYFSQLMCDKRTMIGRLQGAWGKLWCIDISDGIVLDGCCCR